MSNILGDNSRVVVLTELDKMHVVKKYLFNLMQVTKVQQVTDGDMSEIVQHSCVALLITHSVSCVAMKKDLRLTSVSKPLNSVL